MPKSLLIISFLFLFGCEEDPIFGLERGWLRTDKNSDENEGGDNNTSDVSYSIAIDKPNGGENWEIGDSEDIRWESDAPQGQMVGIQLFRNSNYLRIIASQTSNTGEFAWIIPSDLTNANDYRVRIFLYDYPQIEDFSDGFFTIEQGDSVGDLPNYECNIIHETTGTTFTLINPSQNIYNFGDTYTVTLYSDTYNVGQQGGVILKLNNNTIYNFGSWLVFDSNGQRDFTLPSESENIYPSNCYTIVVIGYNQQDEYVSEPITIY